MMSSRAQVVRRSRVGGETGRGHRQVNGGGGSEGVSGSGKGEVVRQMWRARQNKFLYISCKVDYLWADYCSLIYVTD